MMPSIWFETPESLLGTGVFDVGTVEVRCYSKSAYFALW